MKEPKRENDAGVDGGTGPASGEHERPQGDGRRGMDPVDADRSSGDGGMDAWSEFILERAEAQQSGAAGGSYPVTYDPHEAVFSIPGVHPFDGCENFECRSEPAFEVKKGKAIFTLAGKLERPLFQTIRLFTRQGDVVTDIEMPRWLDGMHPEVLVWGVRFFVPKWVDGALCYFEVFGWVAPLGGDPILPDGSH